MSESELIKLKEKYRVPAGLYSCHTALVENYVIEGHVPADLISRILKEKPPILGLGVPGMPIGSPGMDGPNPQPYDVIAFDQNGEQKVFASR